MLGESGGEKEEEESKVSAPGTYSPSVDLQRKRETEADNLIMVVRTCWKCVQGTRKPLYTFGPSWTQLSLRALSRHLHWIATTHPLTLNLGFSSSKEPPWSVDGANRSHAGLPQRPNL